MEIKYEVAVAERDSQAVFELINQAYEVEDGDAGVAFKKVPRLLNPFDCGMDESFKKGQILLAKDQDALVGCIVWGLASSTQDGKIDIVHFGPLAVAPQVQGKGVGSKLMSQVVEIGRANQCKWVEISVVNWRTDILPMYKKKGFQVVSEGKFPDPERCTRESFFYVMRKQIDE